MAQSALCTLCRELTLEKLLQQQSTTGRQQSTTGRQQRSLLHHESFSSLLQSALCRGCPLCILFHRAVLTEYASRRRGWSALDVTCYHYQLDEADVERAFVFAVELTWLWSRAYREEEEEEEEEGSVGNDRRFNGLCYARHTRRDLRDDDENHLSMYTTSDTCGRGPSSQVLPWLALTTPRIDHPRVIGRAVSLTPDIALCREWILECSGEHAGCATIEDTVLPTRLIDVGGGSSGEAAMTTHPRLVVPSDMQRGRYVALSHCWGAVKTLCTTTQNILRHQACLPLESLPLTFKHAVLVTRLLGYTYLWIDSLCILQDSAEDWQIECGRMEQIYENAAVVVAGPAAASSASGFYYSRSTPALPPCRLPGSDGDELFVSLSGVSSAADRLPPTQEGSILATRGWIIQERLLAQRVLYFGSDQSYFECDHTLYFESSWEPIESRDDYTKGMVNCSRGKNALLRWYRTVEIYTACHITRPTDRLPALAGLARRYSKLVGDTYVAGLWRNYLIHGLQWCLHGGPGGLRLEAHRGPSWSWACVDSPVSYDTVDLLHRSAVKYRPLVDIHTVCAEVSGLDDFGEVNSGRIQLSGQLLPITFRPSTQQLERSRALKNSATVVYQGHEIAAFWPDYQDWEKVIAEKAGDVFCLPLAACSAKKMFGCCGIAIERIDRAGIEHVYRRLGFFYANPPKHKQPCSCDLTAADHAFLWAAHRVHKITLV